MNIREATRGDVAAISELLIQLAERFIVGSYSEEGRDTLLKSFSPKAIHAYFEQGYRYHVGETDGTIIGVVATKDNGHLYHLFVHETCQGRGYARALWEVAKADCLARGSPGRFTVNSSLNAQDVYRAFGFEPIDGIRDSGGVKFIPMASERTGARAGSTPRRTEQLKSGGDRNAESEFGEESVMKTRECNADLAVGWIEAWIRMDMEWLRQRLAPDFVHVSPFGRFEGREAYLEAVEPIARKSVLKLKVKEVIASDDRAAVRFENRTPGGVVETCDWLRIENGVIREINSFYDSARIREILSPSEQDSLDGSLGPGVTQ